MRLLAVVACSLTFAAGAWAAAPAARHTSAGNTAAKASLLTLANLGKGWTEGKPGTAGLVLSCPGWTPSGKGVVETGIAQTGSLSAGAIGPFVSQSTSVYGSPKEASTYWSRAVKPGLVTCVAQTVEALRAQGLKVAITRQGGLPLGKVADLVAGYRVVATLTSPTTSYKRTLYFDVLLVGHGAALSEITLSSFASAVPSKVETALATVVARKLGVQSA